MLKKLATQTQNFYTHHIRMCQKNERAYIVNVRLMLRFFSKSTVKIAFPAPCFIRSGGSIIIAQDYFSLPLPCFFNEASFLIVNIEWTPLDHKFTAVQQICVSL